MENFASFVEQNILVKKWTLPLVRVIYRIRFSIKTIQVMILKSVFVCDVTIRRNLCWKLQNVDKGDGTRHNMRNIYTCFSNFNYYLEGIETSHSVYMLNLIIM